MLVAMPMVPPIRVAMEVFVEPAHPYIFRAMVVLGNLGNLGLYQ